MIKLVPALATLLAVAALVPAPAEASTHHSAAPHLGALSPTAGPTSGGNVVTIRGHHLGRVTAVTFGSARARKLRHLSPSRITVRAPVGVRGKVRVRPVSNGGHKSKGLSYRFGPAAKLRSTRRTEIDPSGGIVASLSCPSDEFCAGTEGHNLIVIRTGHPPQTTPSAGGLAVACGTPTFCIAQRAHTARFWNGTTWSAGTQLGPDIDLLEFVSCAPGTTTCLGTGYEQSVLYTGTSFHEVDPPDTPDRLTPSCATATFCMAVNGVDSYSFDGTDWTDHGEPTGLSTTVVDPARLSCPATDFCLASNPSGRDMSRWDGTSWHSVAGPRLGVGPVCRAADDCIALDVDANRAAFFSGGQFGPNQTVPGAGSFRSVACAPAGTCFATDNHGQLLTESGGTWSAPVGITQPAGELQDISCARASWCVAVDVWGNAIRGGKQGWHAPKSVDDQRSLVAVSCTTQHLCAAVDDDGYAVIFQNGSWSAPTDIDGSRHLRDVACAGSNRCVTIDNRGDALTWQGTEWSEPLRIAHGLTSVSCASKQMCAAVGPGGMRVLDHGNWSKTRPPSHTELRGIDCLRDDYCVAADSHGFSVWHHKLWSTATGPTGARRYADAVSCSSDLVCLGGDLLGDGEPMLSISGAAWRGVNAPGSSHISCVAGRTCFLITRQAVTTISTQRS